MAQGDSDEPRRISGRSVWFACTSLPDGVENPVKLMTGKNITELELSRYMASEPVKIPADGIIRIVREEQNAETREKDASLGFELIPPKYLVLAQAKIPDNVREALIILVPLETPKDDLIFTAKVQDLAAFKGGDRLYINHSDSLIRVQLGDTTVAVAPGQANIYEAAVLAEPVNMPILYEVFHPEDRKWKMFSASTVVIRPTRRQLYIFNSGTRPGNIKKHGIVFPVQMKEQ